MFVVRTTLSWHAWQRELCYHNYYKMKNIWSFNLKFVKIHRSYPANCCKTNLPLCAYTHIGPSLMTMAIGVYNSPLFASKFLLKRELKRSTTILGYYHYQASYRHTHARTHAHACTHAHTHTQSFFRIFHSL